ncbi:hypothetical protein A3F65_02795 [Candidatus Saccharibacteria bacterium RIFCSPHIGHO2_12_FULL_47_16b]|nr:MAG: hypothetical protein A3F65_02795 [Candidatus Saccharibacteria bacterium RIFCSPHIGHO2_12_FULL_47_16b]
MEKIPVSPLTKRQERLAQKIARHAIYRADHGWTGEYNVPATRPVLTAIEILIDDFPWSQHSVEVYDRAREVFRAQKPHLDLEVNLGKKVRRLDKVLHFSDKVEIVEA